MLTMLNSTPVNPLRLRIMILATPKTGNTWLRWLLCYAYSLPIVDFPKEWDDGFAAGLPENFVSHQHYPPDARLLRWLVDNGVTVFATVRHPGDAFVSFFHYVKWRHDPQDEAVRRLRSDGDRPGTEATKYLHVPYPQVYALSMMWERLGAIVVKYEDLLTDPLGELRRLCARIAPVSEQRLRTAVLLCKPANLISSGQVDARHLRSATNMRWAQELGQEHVSVLKSIEPFKTAAFRYGYGWDRENATLAPFDYDQLDPFRGAVIFDNGESVTSNLVSIYMLIAEDAINRWPDPRVTEGDSFWNWLRSPCQDALKSTAYPAGTLTNLMMCIRKMRPDIEQIYPQPVNVDRMAFTRWFVGQAHVEMVIPWALVARVQDVYARSLMPESR